MNTKRGIPFSLFCKYFVLILRKIKLFKTATSLDRRWEIQQTMTEISKKNVFHRIWFRFPEWNETFTSPLFSSDMASQNMFSIHEELYLKYPILFKHEAWIKIRSNESTYFFMNRNSKRIMWHFWNGTFVFNITKSFAQLNRKTNIFLKMQVLFFFSFFFLKKVLRVSI